MEKRNDVFSDKYCQSDAIVVERQDHIVWDYTV